jgi:hypothetical protein
VTGTLAAVVRVFGGSDGDATKELYARLMRLGPCGCVAMNLFRAQKCSDRAKLYRGGNSHGSYRAQAYARKQWSIDQLCAELNEWAAAAGIETWGWKIDPKAEGPHRWVLYIDLPGRGQVSFHSDVRGVGPDYAGDWDGAAGSSTNRVQYFTADVIDRLEPLAEASV